ncbi:MAG: hypothetical protein P1V97_39540, partial [Planctomycetota bacterium]|nr:hypothetical protein [Planctomycetota bacterium]
ARRRLIELRKKMFPSQGPENQRGEPSKANEKKRVWAALRQAVKNGRLTEAQAKQRWEGYLKRLKEGGRKEHRKGKEKKRQAL